MGINCRNSIVITVSISLFYLIMSCVPTLATDVLLKWDPNTDSTLAGYRVYYQADSSSPPFTGSGASEGSSPIDVNNVTSTTITGLDPSHTYFFAITAYNTAGLESAYSSIVNISESLAPSVTILSPSNSSNVSGIISVTANASDNIGVTKVEFYVDGSLSAVVTTSPYRYSWNTNAVAKGSHTLSTKAYDTSGNISTSALVTVTVDNSSTAQNAISGDINGDGVVDVSDALLALQFAIGNIQPSSDELKRGDVAPLINGTPAPNGNIDTGDAIVILSVAVGNIAL